MFALLFHLLHKMCFDSERGNEESLGEEGARLSLHHSASNHHSLKISRLVSSKRHLKTRASESLRKVRARVTYRDAANIN